MTKGVAVTIAPGGEAREDNATVVAPAAGDYPPWLLRMFAWPLIWKVALTLMLLILVTIVDTATGSEISFSVFYLLPVLLAGGLVSRPAGRVIAVASAVAWGYLDVRSGGGYSAAWIPVWNSAVRLAFFLIINELVNMLRLAHTHQRALARRDSLTGIANTRVFEEYLSRTIAQSRRNGRPFTLTYLDLDRFKKVNDEFGHNEGDRVLREVSETVQRDLRATDVVARLGGDEFGILMPETDAEQARTSLERIAASLALGVGDRWGVGATFGAVTFAQAPDDTDCALHQADALMYQGKRAGRGCVLQATWPDARVDCG